MKRLSAAKYGRDRATVEAEITRRLQSADIAKEEDKKRRLEAMRNSSIPVPGANKSAPDQGASVPRPGSAGSPQNNSAPTGPGSSFLDDWLAKRQQLKPTPTPTPTPTQGPVQQAPAPAPEVKTVEPASVVQQPLPPATDPVEQAVDDSVRSETINPTTPQNVVAESVQEPQAAQQPEIEINDTPGEDDVDLTTVNDEIKISAIADPEAEIEAKISRELRIARSQAISEMQEKTIIQEDSRVVAAANNELKLQGDSTDEIFIDLQGNIHGGSN